MDIMNDHRFVRQFLLTSQTNFPFAWEKVPVYGYHLYYHPTLEVTTSKSPEKELIMLGTMYDWVKPEQSNQQLLDQLACSISFDAFLQELSGYAGQYVIIYKDKDNFILLNDVGAQCEIYYDVSFTSFGSQPKILNEIIELKPHTNLSAIEFYSSPKFLSKRLFVGESSHVENVKHLKPNYYIDLNRKIIKRFFPEHPYEKISTIDAAAKACQMLKGYVKAIAWRDPIAMGVTAGYDSRVLFLASLDVDCKYFVLQHRHMNDKHYDIKVSQELTKMYGKYFEVIRDSNVKEDISGSVDFQRNILRPEKYFDHHVYLNGNVSEIARNFYGYHSNLSPEDLSFFSGYSGFKFVTEEYQHWLQNTELFESNGYHVLDMFYWEERMGVWAAKGKTEMCALNRREFSPFNSRDLLVTLLSTPRKDRNYYINKLYYAILQELSPDALKLPVNPCLKLNIIRWMTKCNVYNLYRDLGLKYRFLKF